MSKGLNIILVAVVATQNIFIGEVKGYFYYLFMVM